MYLCGSKRSALNDDFVFGRLLIRALADAIVLIIFMVFPVRCGIYHDPSWARQLPPPPSPPPPPSEAF